MDSLNWLWPGHWGHHTCLYFHALPNTLLVNVAQRGFVNRQPLSFQTCQGICSQVGKNRKLATFAQTASVFYLTFLELYAGYRVFLINNTNVFPFITTVKKETLSRALFYSARPLLFWNGMPTTGSLPGWCGQEEEPLGEVCCCGWANNGESLQSWGREAAGFMELERF